MGRRKIAISYIENQRARHVTFNKRKNGLLKKAMELSLLCNCHIMVTMWDSEGNLYEYNSGTEVDNSLLMKRYNFSKSETEPKEMLNDASYMEKYLKKGDQEDITNYQDALEKKKESDKVFFEKESQRWAQVEALRQAQAAASRRRRRSNSNMTSPASTPGSRGKRKKTAGPVSTPSTANSMNVPSVLGSIDSAVAAAGHRLGNYSHSAMVHAPWQSSDPEGLASQFLSTPSQPSSSSQVMYSSQHGMPTPTTTVPLTANMSLQAAAPQMMLPMISPGGGYVQLGAVSSSAMQNMQAQVNARPQQPVAAPVQPAAQQERTEAVESAPTNKNVMRLKISAPPALSSPGSRSGGPPSLVIPSGRFDESEPIRRLDMAENGAGSQNAAAAASSTIAVVDTQPVVSQAQPAVNAVGAFNNMVTIPGYQQSPAGFGQAFDWANPSTYINIPLSATIPPAPPQNKQ